MQFSVFGQKFTKNSGILQLMDDLGNALASDKPVNMLGGGNPASIAKVNEAFARTLQDIAKDGSALESVSNYSTPQGDAKFLDTLVAFFNRHYDWQLTKENIVLTNGSQNAFFYLFNLFSGKFADGDKSILLPLAPEYVGYADAHIDGSHFVAVPPKIVETTHAGKAGFFKYQVDFAALEALPELENGKIGAICCSRPTNPTGNVLTDDEMARLDALAKKHGIPLIIDNAYGTPFPNIIHTNATLSWNENTVLCFSLSKIGLPGVRTGIIVANPQIVRAVSAMNAIVNLSPVRFGATIAAPLFANDEIKTLADTAIRPFYQAQADKAIALLQSEFADLPVKIHKPEGAIFLWVWFKDLPISTTELYEKLKAAGTLIIPSEHFFVGIDTKAYPHAHECIRLSIAQPDDTLQKGIATIGQIVRKLYTDS
ncbi:valine--pyruvate transaminase [Moraxella caviae]|uniref:Aspartate aminotransferase n=1 Tax=Moraxella caviae TaxID=34060 RepID=A0A1S9ZX85_9GAMM|nr:valine--pyruvate transaminase [Moraxella caviae]OOR88156.1 valine--pyruvate transaminase [Moraxella caviae]STZ10509.1 Aspartate aminotransferase [Moraxella caviae]VEW13201.1 Aspartate aminotransferase [Moraxella caviae]